MTLEQFQALPKLSTFFPLVFDDGARWERFRGYCVSCDGLFPDEAVRGTVSRPFATYRGNDGTFLIDAWGLCTKCNKTTHFDWRLLSDMTMVGRDKDGGLWKWLPQRPWWSELQKLMQRLF